MNSGKENTALEEAKVFLEEVLTEGERPQVEIDEEAESQGIAQRTLHRAKKELGIVARKQGIPGERGKGQWFWRLPE